MTSTGLRNLQSAALPQRPSWKRTLAPGILVLAAFVAIAPQLIRGNSCGHDFNFHFFSWLDLQHSWSQGIFYPRWASSPDYGAGEPRFIFYPPLEMMAGAALGSVLPWNLVPIALTFLILAGAGLATRALAREAMDDGPAILAGCAAIFFGYAMFTAYERTDFAELTGAIWMPLLLLYILRDRNPAVSTWKRALDGSTALLALPLAAAWLSNAPLGVMASYLVAAMALLAAVTARSWAPILRASIAAALGIALAAVYIVPAAWEERWVAIDRATGDLGAMVQGSWLFAHHSDPDLALHDYVLHQVSVILVAMVAATFCGVFISWRRGRLPGERKWWLPLAVIPLLVLLLQFPFSFPVWNRLPELHFLQFPWRWLVALEAPMGIFLAAAVWPANHRLRIAVIPLCAASFAVATFWAGYYWFQPSRPEDTVAALLARFHDGTVLDDSDQFAPPDSDDDLLALGLPDACLVSDPLIPLGQQASDGTVNWNASQGTCKATFSAIAPPGQARAEHLLIQARLDQAGYLVLRLRTYPAWRISVNGRTMAGLPVRDDGLMAVPVPSGAVQVAVNWTMTPDVIAGWSLSYLSAIAIVGLYLMERKRVTSRLSLVRCLPT